MRSPLPHCWCSVSILLIAYGMLVPYPALAQAWPEAEEQTKRLVVMITAGVNVGAGICLWTGQDGVYIATAHHLVGISETPIRRGQLLQAAGPHLPGRNARVVDIRS